MKQRQVFISVICLLLAISVGCYSEKHIEAVDIFEESGDCYASVGQQIVRKGQAKEFQAKFATMSREEIESITLEELQQLGVLDYNECFESIVEPLHLPEGVSEWDIYGKMMLSAESSEEAYQRLIEKYTPEDAPEYLASHISERITLIDEQEVYWLYHYQENQSTDHYVYFFKEEYYCAENGTAQFELTEENIYEFFRVYLYDEFLQHTEIAVYIEETEEKYYYIYYDICAGTLTHAYTTGIYKELYDVVLVRQVYSIDKKTLEVKYEEERRGYMKYDYHPSPEPYVVNW